MGVGNLQDVQQPLNAAILAKAAMECIEYGVGPGEEAAQQGARIPFDVNTGHLIAGIPQGAADGGAADQ